MDVRQALEEAPQLEPFFLPNVRSTGRQLGGGSYGVVEELETDGVLCAGKKIYDTLIDPENQGAQRMVERYYRECSLLSELRHPHIVQFLGICFLPDSQLPVLVMERLQGSLDDLLETTPNIPLSKKLSILQDVASGLVFMHSRSQPVIHRDLTARNVLLNAAMTAKIADLGNSRIANLRPDQIAQTMTQGIPGTLVYMPPEALGSTQRYGPPLDMFSFGHLSLFTATQVFPRDLRTPTYHDPHSLEVKARSELQRRERYINVLDETFGDDHLFVVFIKECLEYEPVKRPTARQALERLGAMKATEQDPNAAMNRLQLEMALKEKEAQFELQAYEKAVSVDTIRQLHEQLQNTKIDMRELEEVCTNKDEELQVARAEVEQLPMLKKSIVELQEEKRGMNEVCQGKDKMLVARELEIAAKERALETMEGKVVSLVEQCASLRGELAKKSEVIHSQNMDIQRLQTDKLSLVSAKEREMKQVILEKELQIAAKDHQLKEMSLARSKERIEHELQLSKRDTQLSAKESRLSEEHSRLFLLQQRCDLSETQLDTAQGKIQSLQEEIIAMEQEVKRLTAENEFQLLTTERVTSARNEEIAAHELELQAKDALLLEKVCILSSLQQQCCSLETQLDTMKMKVYTVEADENATTEMLALKDANINALLTVMKGKDRMLQSKHKAVEFTDILKYNLPLKWKKRKKMKLGVVEAQSVVIGGKMYIGGGRAEGGQYKILIEPSLQGEAETPVMGFSMAAINDQLIICGGRRREGSITNQLWLLEIVTNTWTQPFPEMPTARWFSSAVGYKKWILVVDGDGEKCIEVLDTISKRWYIASKLPSNAFRPSLTVLQDALYIVWGKTAVSVSIPMLLSDAISQSQARDPSDEASPITWHMLPNTLTDGPTITSFHSYLLTIGAGKTSSSTVAMYLPHTHQWLPVAQLIAPRCGCTCVALPETKELMIIGGDDEMGKYVKTIDTCYI